MFAYDLAFTPGATSTFALATAGPSPTAAVLPDLMSPALTLMSTTFDAWIDREGDLRAVLTGGNAAATDQDHALWIKMFAAERDVSAGGVLGVNGTQLAYDRNHHDQIAGFLAGVDVARLETPDGGIVNLGAMAGYATADASFDTTAVSADYKGGILGAYASYLQDRFYLDTAVQADILNMSASLGTAGSASDADVFTFGARVEAGYRADVGPVFFEPSVALDYAKTRVGNVSAASATVDFEPGESLVGRVAVRAGSTVQVGDSTWLTPSATIGANWQLLGDLDAAVASGGATFPVASTLPSNYFDASLGLDIVHGPTAAFLRANAVFGNNIHGIGAKLGVSVQF